MNLNPKTALSELCLLGNTKNALLALYGYGPWWKIIDTLSGPFKVRATKTQTAIKKNKKREPDWEWEGGGQKHVLIRGWLEMNDDTWYAWSCNQHINYGGGLQQC